MKKLLKSKVLMTLFCLILSGFWSGPVFGGNDATFIKQKVPNQMVPGQTYKVKVIVKNTGTKTWKRKKRYKLGSQSPQDNFNWGLNRVYLKKKDRVKPGQRKTFRFSVQAPVVPGTYAFKWKMVQDLVEWFGASSPTVMIHVQSNQNGGGGGSGKVDATTIDKKVLFGYQGWFAAKGDGSKVGWFHWARGGKPHNGNVTIDLWPDTSEYPSSVLYDTHFKFANGKKAKLFSSYHYKTVDLHFRWMKDYGIHGVFLQRFLSDLRGKKLRGFRDQVTKNVMKAADQHGRVFAIMYDISGFPQHNLAQAIKKDWKKLVDKMKITSAPGYLKEGGRPVLAIWGFGFKNRPGTAQQAKKIIDWFRTKAPKKYRVYLVGGVPYYWRGPGVHHNDSKPGFLDVYKKFDALCPWSVGRYGSKGGFDNLFNSVVKGDKAFTSQRGIDYAPVSWPGFSWANLKPGAPMNHIPRQGGRFFWHQVYRQSQLNCKFYYVAMFDEVDEGTAMFKALSRQQETPVNGNFLYLNIDGYNLPSDWYLRLGGAFTEGVTGKRQIGPNLPFSP